MKPLKDRIAEANTRLHPHAVPFDGHLGRSIEEPEDETRSPFQRDRDRILHATAFRRLQGKTQVFVAGEGDHLRTRLTHTLEVAQIARDVARALSLNEDLAECVALAHDLGHPPFGHRGEEALDRWMLEHDQHFEHNEQSFRIVTILEKRSTQYVGLNLNREIEDGLLKHSSTHPTEDRVLMPTLEADVANLADEIAYVSHDCDDGLIAGLFSKHELIKIPLARDAYEIAQKRGTYIRGSIVRLLVEDLFETSQPLLDHDPSEGPRITLSAAMREQVNELRTFLAERMYPHPRVYKKAEEGMQIIDVLCREYFAHPHEKILNLQERTGSSLVEAVKDYVAGMTDSFAWLQTGELGLLDVIDRKA